MSDLSDRMEEAPNSSWRWPCGRTRSRAGLALGTEAEVAAATATARAGTAAVVAAPAVAATADAAAGAVSETIIQSITCPITADIMRDPVQGNDGQTYEREAIVQALNIKSESPITRAPMTVRDLQVNAAISISL